MIVVWQWPFIKELEYYKLRLIAKYKSLTETCNTPVTQASTKHATSLTSVAKAMTKT